VEASLRRLQIESIPLLQLHWPDTNTPLHDTLQSMDELRAEGKVRHVGVCNLSADALREVAADFRIESVQVAYNLLCRRSENGLLDAGEAHGISVLAHSALARGFLSGKYAPGHTFLGTDTRNASRYFSLRDGTSRLRLIEGIRQVAHERGRSCSATAIRWVLDMPGIAAAMTGIKTLTQLEDNLDAIGWNLSPDQYARLARLSAACAGSLNGDLAGKEADCEVVSNHN
jgi:aryl-alcohol dehydrogenase-like predicted oxidoreductase